MKHLTGSDLYLFLSALLASGALESESAEGQRARKEVWERSLAAKIYGPRLAKAHATLAPRLENAPQITRDTFAEIDASFDRHARCLRLHLDAYEGWDNAPTGAREIAARLKAVFVPSSDVWTASYADEVASLPRLRAAFAEHRAGLESLGAMATGLVQGMITSLETLAGLLEAAGNALSTSVPRGFVSRARGEISAFRQALKAETETNPELPAQAEEKVFGYLDLLAERRNRNASRKAEAPANPA